MKLTGARRWAVLLLVLGVTVVAAMWEPSDSGAQVRVAAVREPAAAAPRVRAPAAALPELDWAALEQRFKREGEREAVGDAFAPKSWRAPARPAPPVAAPGPPPAPQAPALPFTYLGQLQEDGRTVVFLAAQGSNYPVRVGDSVLDAYRVERITERAVTLRYLPLDLEQTLPIGEPR
jgi:hypothetical protein